MKKLLLLGSLVQATGAHGAEPAGIHGRMGDPQPKTENYCDTTFLEMRARHQRVDFKTPGLIGGGYFRFSNDGKYMIASTKHASLYELKEVNGKLEIKETKTQMNSEAYPVMGKGPWRWVTSPLHNDRMHYYAFDDLLKQGPKATPPVLVDLNLKQPRAFTDPGLFNYYQSAAELPGSTAKNTRIRVSSWDDLEYRDIEIYSTDEGKPESFRMGDINNLCANYPKGSLSSPVLSRDGMEFSAFEGTTTKIFRILPNGNCEQVEDLGANVSKITFGPVEKGKKGKIVYHAPGRFDHLAATRPGMSYPGVVFHYDRDTQVTTRVSDLEGMHAEHDGGKIRLDHYLASYPGLLDDGRVMYVESIGYENYQVRRLVIADPTPEGEIKRREALIHPQPAGGSPSLTELFQLLGEIWYEACSSPYVSAGLGKRDFISKGLAMRDSQCVKLVKDRFKEWITRPANRKLGDRYTPEVLEAACRSYQSTPVAPGADTKKEGGH